MVGNIPTGFLVGLVTGGILGFTLGFLLASASIKSEEKKAIKKESKAEKLFNLAMQQESKEKKLDLLRKILTKYPRSEWSDKALEEVTKIRREKR